MSGIAPKLPLQLDESDGAYKLIKNYKELVRQNMKMVVLTSPGERIMDPEFGAGVRNFLFENGLNSEAARDELSSVITVQVNRYLPFVTIEIVDVFVNENNRNRVDIRIQYNIDPIDVFDDLSFSTEVRKF